ncbi:MAG: LptF/LptG family permease [Bacteroidetes bacterium]|nr:LptF/LptG family permease [Bacteroidota bacterium]
MDRPLQILDRYILKKFLGTFFLSIILIMFIVIVFDVSEKIEDFLQPGITLHAIVFDYYVNFVPYFVNLFSPLFTFISVIYFTSRLASRTEIVAILSSGVSFNRFLRPYLIGASVIAAISLVLNNFIIPMSNKIRIDFMDKYIDKNYVFAGKNIHRKISDGVFVYMSTYDAQDNSGSLFTMEKFRDRSLISKMYAREIQWDSIHNRWSILDSYTRFINGKKELLTPVRPKFDTSFDLSPKDFGRAENEKECMTTPELRKFIENERLKGSDSIGTYEIELQNRFASPFATFILTLIGVSVSSRKVRGGIGRHLGFGLALSFIFIFLNQLFVSYAQNGSMPSMLAVWLPNIIFLFVCFYLLRKAPK